MTPAFLLTRQWADTPDGVRLDFWLSTAKGPMAVSIHGQRVLFFNVVTGVEQLSVEIKLVATVECKADAPRVGMR